MNINNTYYHTFIHVGSKRESEKPKSDGDPKKKKTPKTTDPKTTISINTLFKWIKLPNKKAEIVRMNKKRRRNYMLPIRNVLKIYWHKQIKIISCKIYIMPGKHKHESLAVMLKDQKTKQTKPNI